MNKTISVNLGGSVFNIEEDAFLLLKNYLDRIKLNFTGDPGESEIMSDIEVRISELFLQRLDERKNVVVKKDVEEVISVMGQPEDFNIGNENSSGNTYHANDIRNSNRRLYRDQDDARIGGVCSGLSHYLGWDPVIIRILFVIIGIASAGTAILAYIIFWAVVPAAETTGEKLQMRGEPVNVDNIRRFVQEEARRAGDTINTWGRKAGRSAGNGGREFISVIGMIITKIFGVLILFLGIALLVGLVTLLFFSQASVWGNQVDINTLNAMLFNNDGSIWMLTIGTVLSMGIPAIALIYGGIRLLVGSTRRIRGLSWSLTSLFIIGIIMLTIGGVHFGREWTKDAKMKKEFVLDAEISDTLYVEVLQDTIFTGRNTDEHHDFFDLVKMTDSTIIYGEPVSLEFETANDRQFKIRIERKSNGSTLEEAGKRAEAIEYPYSLKGNTLVLPPHFSTPRSDKFRGQEVQITVFVPEGKSVHFGEYIGLINWHDEFAGKAVMMTDDGWAGDEHELREYNRRKRHERGVHISPDSIVVDVGDIHIRNYDN